MTQKIYETDSYVQSFTARVLQCSPAPGGFAVVLDRTAFFPEGGGQPCDLGTLGAAHVTDVHTDGTTITHTTDTPLEPGAQVIATDGIAFTNGTARVGSGTYTVQYAK